MNRRRLASLLLLGVAAQGAISCYSVQRTSSGYQREGVWLPKRAPDEERYAGRERLTLEGRELLYDESLGVYVVHGEDDLFYLGGWFYRRRGGGWEISRSPSGTWTSIETRRLPPGLRRRDGSSLAPPPLTDTEASTPDERQTLD